MNDFVLSTKYLLAALLFICAAARADDLADRVAARLASYPIVRAEFVQERTVASLTKPVVSTGRLVFSREGLTWQVETPVKAVMTFSADGASDGGAAQAEMGRLVRALVAGDLRELRQSFDIEPRGDLERWTLQLLHGDYAQQPEIGFLNRREGILGSARLKVTENWVLLGAAQYDLIARSIVQTQLGLGYIDDCLILALNYITSYAYSGSVSVNHTFMMQITLRTLGGSTSSQSPTAAGTGVGLPGLH